MHIQKLIPVSPPRHRLFLSSKANQTLGKINGRR